MEYNYEVIHGHEGLPVKTIIHAVDSFQMHWHNEIEIILVLEGSVSIKIGEDTYYLEENDIILINNNELHSTNRTKDENILLALQINSAFYNNVFPDFSKLKFNCKPLKSKENDKVFDDIRYYIAKIVWELNKKDLGYQLRIASYSNLLGEYLLNNFDYDLIDEVDEELRDTDLARLQRIMEYVNENFNKKITLKEIAENEHLNYYYLSHFIKNKIGMSFQEYLNTVRLDKAVRTLVSTDMSIIDVSNTSGFSNINSFNNIFKDTYNCTPTEFRKSRDYKANKNIERVNTYLDVDRDAALKKLFTYLEINNEPNMKESYIKEDTEVVDVNIKKNGRELEHYWSNLLTFGRAHEGLRNNWQKQFLEIQNEIRFNYIRFHGIFMDEMMVYNISPNGDVIYNWTYVDELFDFFIENNIKPFVELGFMPDELKKTDATIFWWKGNISPPKDTKLWTDLVKEFITHCINRYGIKEVESWYFEVWNEPEYVYTFWAGSKEEYFIFYKDTALGIKSISQKLKVGGPAITHGTILGSTWLDDFLIFCKDGNVPLDFLSIHIYPEYITDESKEKAYALLGKGVDLLKMNFKPKRIYHHVDHFPSTLDIVNEKLENILGEVPEVHITEWNASSHLGNLIHDTCYVSTYIIRNILKSIDKVDSVGYWTFTDIFEEQKLGISHFHGGFGLMNKDGLKKPSYYAYYLLSKLGNEIIEEGEDYIVTRSGENIQILAYNYVYFDDLFLSGETSHINSKERYMVYENKEVKKLEFNIKEISGNYKIINYKLNRDSGSVFDTWVKMGMPENMSKEEIEYLKGKSKPGMMVEYVGLEGEYRDILEIPVHGVEMVVLEKQM